MDKGTEIESAISTLVKLGLFFRFKDITAYHGRSGDGNMSWNIDPTIDNSGKNTLRGEGYYNSSEIPMLFTSNNRQYAESYASTKQDMVPEIYEIESTTPNALLINRSFYSNKLTEEERNLMTKSLRALTQTTDLHHYAISMPENMQPQQFAAIFNNTRSTFIQACGNNNSYFNLEEVDETCFNSQYTTSQEKELQKQILIVLNTVKLLRHYPRAAIMILAGTKDDQERASSGCIFDSGFVFKWCKHYNIIGEQQYLGIGHMTDIKEAIHPIEYRLFDLNKIQVKEKSRIPLKKQPAREL